MITLYSGTPGSGKSYHAAERCYTLLRNRKINVIVNFDINLDVLSLTTIGWLKYRITQATKGKVKFKKYNKKRLKGHYEYRPNYELTIDYLMQFAQEHHKAHGEGQTIVMIDEAGTIFNCRDFAAKDRREWLDFFAMHRHYGFDFILIQQSDRQLDRQIRYCVEYEKAHRKVRNFKTLGWIMAMLAGGQLFLVRTSWYASKSNLSNNSEMLRYRRRVAAIYDTFARFDDAAPAAQAPSGSRGPARSRAAAPPLQCVPDVDVLAAPDDVQSIKGEGTA